MEFHNQILVSGASGFVGSNVIDRLEKESYDCMSLSRSDLEKFISYPTKFNLKSYAFVHCAGHVHVSRKIRSSSDDEFVKVNTDLTAAVAEAALKINIKKFIYLSSISVFGRFTGGSIDINQAPYPNDPYGESKLCAERNLTELFGNQKTAQCIILRLPMVYGPGNKGNMMPLLKAASKGIPLPLSSTKGKRSLIYVKNLSDAVIRILRDEFAIRPDVATYMLNDRSDLTSGELYDLIFHAYNPKKTGIFFFPEMLAHFLGIMGSGLEAILKKKLPLNKEVISRLFDEYRFSSDLFCQDYNWSPPFTPLEGIKETVEWYKKKMEDQRKPDRIESNN